MIETPPYPDRFERECAEEDARCLDEIYSAAELGIVFTETLPEQIPCSCGRGDCNKRILAHNEFCIEDRIEALPTSPQREAK